MKTKKLRRTRFESAFGHTILSTTRKQISLYILCQPPGRCHTDWHKITIVIWLSSNFFWVRLEEVPTLLRQEEEREWSNILKQFWKALTPKKATWTRRSRSWSAPTTGRNTCRKILPVRQVTISFQVGSINPDPDKVTLRLVIRKTRSYCIVIVIRESLLET